MKHVVCTRRTQYNEERGYHQFSSVINVASHGTYEMQNTNHFEIQLCALMSEFNDLAFPLGMRIFTDGP